MPLQVIQKVPSGSTYEFNFKHVDEERAPSHIEDYTFTLAELITQLNLTNIDTPLGIYWEIHKQHYCMSMSEEIDAMTQADSCTILEKDTFDHIIGLLLFENVFPNGYASFQRAMKKLKNEFGDTIMAERVLLTTLSNQMLN